MPASIRMVATFFPKRVRWEQGNGFFEGMADIVAKTKTMQHEALHRFPEQLRLH